MKSVSVIVPVFNTKEEYLRKCIESLLEQTLKDIEIILVNDASTDNTLSILKEYADKYPNKIVLIDSPKNQKQGGARNLGILKATGAYIGFTDSDDIVRTDMYEKMYNEAVATEADAVLCRFERFSDDGSILGRSDIPEVWRKHTFAKENSEMLFLNSQSVCCKIYKTSLMQKNNILFPIGIFYEDNAWCPLSMLYCDRIAFVDEPLYLYRLNESSTTESGGFSRYFDRCKSALWLDNELKQRNLYCAIKDAADFWFFHCYYASTVKMCIDGFEKVYWKQLRQIRKKIKQEKINYFKNDYYLQNIRGYEQEDKLYMRLAFISPMLAVLAVKIVSFLRKIKRMLIRQRR